MDLSDWLKEIELVFQKEKFTGFQLRSFRPDRFLKMAARLEEFEHTCNSCKSLKVEVDDVMISLKNEDKISESSFQLYMILFKKITNHLKTVHHLIYPRYFSSLFTLIGMVAGLLLGILIWYVIFQSNDLFLEAKTGVMLSGFIGLFTGRLIGNRRDKKVTESNKRIY